MDLWFNASTVFLTDFKPYPNSSFNFIEANQTNENLLGPRTFASLLNSTKLTDKERDDILAGAPFEDGKSTATLFYTVEDYDESLWLYNFNFFYSWNGCSNQAVGLSFNGTLDVSNYIMCPAGIHEGDLERVSMLVCKSDLNIKRIAYSQHGWTEVRNCEAGDCPIDKETGHLVTYVGLESHANYPDNSDLHVYFYQGGNVSGKVELDNLGGVYVGDRTGDDPSKTFIPTRDNIKYVPPAWEIERGIENGEMNEWKWAVYPGNWGAPLSKTPTVLYCFPPDNSSIFDYPCPRNSTVIQTIYALTSATSIGKSIDEQESVSIQQITNSSRVNYPSLVGPLFRSFSYVWEASKSAPVLSAGLTELTCPDSLTALDEFPTLSELNADPDTIVAYLVGITIGTFIFSIFLVLILSLPIILDKSAKAQMIVAKGATTAWAASLAAGKTGYKKIAGKKDVETGSTEQDKSTKEDQVVDNSTEAEGNEDQLRSITSSQSGM